MRKEFRHLARRVGRRFKKILNSILGRLALLLLKAIRWTNPYWMADFGGRFMRIVGPWLPEHRIGRANLAAAFPEKSSAEIENILGGVWDNLGRVAAEFAHIDRLVAAAMQHPGAAFITYGPETLERARQLRTDGKPALLFNAHLANWELPILGANHFQLDLTLLYRRSNLDGIADAVIETRRNLMGSLIPAGPDAAIKLAAALEAGSHVAMLADQHFERGVEVTFFGRRCKANPTIARLARNCECPIHGVRMVRLPDHHTFWAEISEAIEPSRDAEGRVDIQGTMQAITSVMEGWIREHPEQWLWLHRRWR